MNKAEALELAEKISVWIHSQTNNRQFKSERRLHISVRVFQHVLDLADGIVVLIDKNLPGVAWTLARPMHEGYIHAVWILNHAKEDHLDRFVKGICPKVTTLIKQIGDKPESGGAWIKGINELNTKAFHNLTHGGIEHLARRVSETAIEPQYGDEELVRLIILRNQYCIHIAAFLLVIMSNEVGLAELKEKQKDWDILNVES